MSDAATGKPKTETTKQKIKDKRKNQVMIPWSDERKDHMSKISHFRERTGKSYDEIYGNDISAIIRKKQSIRMKERMVDPVQKIKRIAAHKTTWVVKMGDVYRAIFILLDQKYIQKDIIEILSISPDTVRKARRDRLYIEEILNTQ